MNTQYAGGPIHALGELERENYTDGMVYGRIPYIEFDPPLAGPAETLKIKSITYTGKPIQKAASNIISLVDVTLENGIQLKMTIRFTMPLQR